MPALRWGIVSCCKASCDFAEALTSFSREEHVLTSIASTSMKTSQEFSKKYQVPNAYETYDELATDPEVDIVYVAVIIPMHFDLTKSMINNGKHVVCEKPLSFCEKRAKELSILSKIKKVFLMEAMWTKCFPAMDYLAEEIDNGTIGEVLFVHVTYGRSSYNKKKLNLKEIYRGVIMDLGVHALAFQEQIFRNHVSTKVLTAGHLNNQDVDESASCIINYPEGKTCVIAIHTCVDLPNEAIIIGTKGTIRIPHFWFPTKIIMPRETKKFPLPEGETEVSRVVAFKYLIEEVGKCVEDGKLESDRHTHASMLQVVHFMDLWRNQLEVIYEVDDS
ncbi:unnamed protein product [Brassicogethes aeneus]|uniref:Trans-1,2-dihydrobenzene-1,2-diol dehydrogenase n=1 Tax=Brassicogethes aeneus TaxID=1431903 RepID=A0A9P0B9U2_BRAAE|nr:unnamed protein product [Brassicogethes aeneus]